jgi:toxin YoeB
VDREVVMDGALVTRPAPVNHRHAIGGQPRSAPVRLVFEDEGCEDYTSWLKTDRKMLARINELTEDVLRDPFSGIGKPEPLKCHLPGPGHGGLTTSTASSTSSPKKRSSFSARYHY